jgi:hypothetical protein
MCGLQKYTRTTGPVYQSPLAHITPVLSFTRRLRARHREFDFGFAHDKYMVRHVCGYREKLLPLFGKADAAYLILSQAHGQRLDRNMASAMVGAMLSAFGAKADADVLAGMLDMLEGGDEIAGMLGMYGSEDEGAESEGILADLWQPLELSAAGLALACRSLIASAKFTPKPAELRAACRKAENHLRSAADVADALVDFVRRCDAVLLEFDHAEWERPYLTPEYRPILERMLELHAIYGDDSEAWDDRRECDGKVHPFERLVRAEQDKLALPVPPESEPMREAACETRPAKRTRRPKRG